MADEIWRPVVGFEDCYEVSDRGRVRSLARTCRNRYSERKVSARILKPQHDGRSCGGIGAHTKVCLSVDGVATQRQVHILVLEAFIGPRPPGHETRHLNGTPDDNRLLNLKWGTPAENRADTLRHGTLRKGMSKPNAKFKDADISVIRSAYSSGVGVVELSRRYRVAHETVRQILDGRTWTHVVA